MWPNLATLCCPANLEPTFACLYRSADYPDERQIFLVSGPEKQFALKLDTKSSRTRRLETEYGFLQQVQKHFQAYERVSCIKPVYMSPRGAFFVTEFVGRRTATEAIHDFPQDNRAAQVYRRAGEWLHAFHEFKGLTTERFWYNWMFETIERLLKNTRSQAPEREVRQYLDMMHRDAEKLEGVRDTKVLCHGDFHGRNLILDAGCVYGLDFTEVSEKLAVYDIVDFLKADVFRPGSEGEVDRSGILRHNKDMFFKLYRHPINIDVLDFAMRARLLIDWVGVTQERFQKSAFQRKKFGLLENRLKIAFASPI